jgi:hypothetical protein
MLQNEVIDYLVTGNGGFLYSRISCNGVKHEVIFCCLQYMIWGRN